MKLLIGVVLMIASATVGAQDRKFYAGGHLGQSEFKGVCEPFNLPGVSCDEKGDVAKAIGGYQVNQHFAAEVGYAYLGEAKASGPGGTVTAESWAAELVAVGTIPVANRFALYGKAGIYRATTEVRVNTLTLRADESETNTDLTFGFGLRFDFTPRLFGRAEWQRYQDVGGGNIGETDINVISVGVAFRF